MVISLGSEQHLRKLTMAQQLATSSTMREAYIKKQQQGREAGKAGHEMTGKEKGAGSRAWHGEWGGGTRSREAGQS